MVRFYLIENSSIITEGIITKLEVYQILVIGIFQSLIEIYKTIVFITIPKINYFLGDNTQELFWSSGTSGGELFCRERFLRIISEKIVNFWSRYDYNRLVDFYQILEDSNDKDLVDFELRNYSFRCNRTVLDKEEPYHELPLVRRLAAASLLKCRDKVKHKRLNDSFGIFTYHD